MITYEENKALMAELWPRWRLEPALASVLHEKWSKLHQDKLRDCIRQHRMHRDATPDISAIHKAYCAITGLDRASAVPDATKTRKEAMAAQGPTAAELEAWDVWAEHTLSTATPAEIAAAKERLGLASITQPRVLALMVDWCRKNPRLR